MFIRRLTGHPSQDHCEWCTKCPDCARFRTERIDGTSARRTGDGQGGLYVCDTCYAARELIEAAIVLGSLALR